MGTDTRASCRSLSMWRAIAFVSLALLAGCAMKYDYSVTYRAQDFSVKPMKASRMAVILSSDVVGLDSLSPAIGDPNLYESRLLGRLRECLSGQFQYYHPWQADMRNWMREHVTYIDAGDERDRFVRVVEFVEGRHGASSARLADSGTFSDLCGAEGYDYVIYLHGLAAGSTSGVSVAPNLAGTLMGSGSLDLDYVSVEYPVIGSQFFIFSPSSQELLYQGYVIGNNGTSSGRKYSDHVLSFTGQLVRGVLAVK